MDLRKRVDPQASGLMAVLCIIWGVQQVIMKMAAADISPIMQVAVRSGVAAVLVWLLIFIRGERLQMKKEIWLPGIAISGLFSLEYLFVGEGLRYTSASHSVVFLYTAPIFAGLGLHWRLAQERLRPLQWVGIFLAFTGILVVFAGHGLRNAAGQISDVIWGDFLALLGGISWGATTVVIRCSRLARMSASETLFYQLVGAFFLLTAAAYCLGQATIQLTSLFWMTMAFQSLIVSFASFLVWLWLLRHYLASRLGVFSFMTPFFGVGFGVWLLREPLDSHFLTGAGFVLAGILLVSGYEWLVQLLQKVKAVFYP